MRNELHACSAKNDIDVLRRQVRILNRMVCGLATLSVLLLLLLPLSATLADARSQTGRRIEAEEIVLKHPGGKAAIVLGLRQEAIGSGSHGGASAFKEGVSPRLAFLDGTGRVGLELGVGADSRAWVTLTAATGERLEIRTDPQAQLNLYGPSGHAVSLACAADGSNLSLYGRNSGDEARLAANADGSVLMRLYKEGNLRVALGDLTGAAASKWGVKDRPTSSLVFIDGKGNLVHSIP